MDHVHVNEFQFMEQSIKGGHCEPARGLRLAKSRPAGAHGVAIPFRIPECRWGLPRQCAHWLAMTIFFDGANRAINRNLPADGG